MKNYIILSGSANTPYDNWYKWVKDEIETKGFNACVPYLPQGEYCNYKAWEKILIAYKNAGMIGKETTIICHDVSCVFATRFIIQNKIQIEGIIAVAPFNTMLGMEQDQLNKSFIIRTDKLQKIERFVKFYHCMCSSNDPFVSDEIFDNFCESVGAKKHEIEGAGHFDAESGYVKFPELITLIDNINKII